MTVREHFHLSTPMDACALLIFVFSDISRELLGPPDCPIQYVCFHDDENVLRYNSTVAALRWRVHASDSNKHWLTWTALVCMGLSLRVAVSILWRNPSYFIRAMTADESAGTVVKSWDAAEGARERKEAAAYYRSINK